MAAERRYQVFVSSTYQDLKDERSKVMQALLGIEMFPAGMELFPASNETQWDLIKRVIDDSDYYLVILGARYGSLDSDGLSYTEKEYHYAVETGTPVFGFVLSDPMQAVVANTDQNQALAKRLRRFREVVMSKMCQQYSNPDELALNVTTSLIAAKTRFPTDGWVRGSDATTSEAREQLLEAREQLQEARARLAALDGFEVDKDLHQGDDTYGVIFEISSISGYSEKRLFHYQRSWNQLFMLLGPTLLDEASEKALKERLRNAPLEDESADLDIFEAIDVSNSSFDQVKMQFVALGLVARSDRKRSVRDAGTYWQLTELGRTKLMSLGALRHAATSD